jgi:ERF superfamily
MATAVKTIEHDDAPKSPAVITPAAMINRAIESGSGPEVMSQLLTLQKEWDAMQAKKSFDNAMAELRQNMPTVVKRQSADFGKGGAAYKYEDLSAITEAISPIMADAGLSFRWRTTSDKSSVSVTCIISHRDGHAEETTLTAGMDTSGSKNAIQALGSAVTYLQRYTLKAAIGIAAAKDDDGHAAGPSVDATAPSRDTKARAIYSEAEHKIRTAKTKDDLKEVWEAINWTAVPDEWKRDLVNEKNARIKVLSEPKKYVEPDFSQFEPDEPFPGDTPLEG